MSRSPVPGPHYSTALDGGSAPRGGPLTVPVNLGVRSYSVVIGRDLLRQTGAQIWQHLEAPSRVITIADATVARLHGGPVLRSLEVLGVPRPDPILVPPGEGAKDFASYQRVCEAVLAAGLDRRSLILALGGGVIGDLAGFVAATVMRGVPFVQVPTTLLAQVDSSVGGKTGINTAAGKNLVGAFHQPALVVADLEALTTLPERERQAGYAEIVKYGLIDQPALFDWLEAHGTQVISGRDHNIVAHAVAESVRAKARVVAADEHETSGARALLNLGHTFGHALEAVAGYDGRLLHGEAVAIGLGLAFRLSARLGLCAATEAERVVAHLRAVGLPVVPASRGLAPDPDRLLALMAGDKKADGGRLTLILARGIGRAVLVRDVDVGAVRAVWAEALAG